MKCTQLMYQSISGWSEKLPVELDSPQTLLLVFGALEYIDTPKPITELVQAFPLSHIVGCSTAGEILGPTVSDHSLAVMVVQFEHTHLVVATTTISNAQGSFN